MIGPSLFTIFNIDIEEIVLINIAEEEPKSESDKNEENPKLVFEEDSKYKSDNRKKNINTFTYYKDISSSTTIKVDLPPPEFIS